ncbi:hypothetical protein [Porphyrobacter sp. ULC335]|uniref:hypothetical protein n=1 Tax=Porphyrobacter sp. ULC335 TaxID=2854260 RepID=UPI00221E97AC|nr:hypothetical protein [Porphyrobacter sp. ULC335]
MARDPGNQIKQALELTDGSWKNLLRQDVRSRQLSGYDGATMRGGITSAAQFALEEIVKHEMGRRGDHDQFPAVRTEFVQLIGIHGFGDEFVFPLHSIFSGCCDIGIWAADGHAHRRQIRGVPDLRRPAIGKDSGLGSWPAALSGRARKAACRALLVPISRSC